MNLDEIDKKCFILALFIRDDGQRFLLGSGAYEFKDSQLHFAANTMSNDVVEVQGNDGYLLAGQVRRPTTQVFDGYIGDASINKSDIEGYRRDFFAFFQKNHFYTVVYIFPDGTAIQRRRGFIVDAGEIRELYQMFPEYHIGFNFEDVNYYKYAEDEDGHEQYAKSIDINISKAVSGGLIWDEVSQTQAYNHGTDFSISGTIEDEPVDYIDLYGDTQQTTYSGKNLLKNLTVLNTSDNGVSNTLNSDGSVTCSGTVGSGWNGWNVSGYNENQLSSGTYTFSIDQTISYAINVSFRDAGNTTLATANIQAGSKSATVTVNGQIAKTSLWLTATTGSSVNFTIKPQLESGSTATSFEPYVGGTASPNPDYPQEVQTVTGRQVVTISDGGSESQEYEINLGKNLLPFTNQNFTKNNVTFSVTDGTLYLDGTSTGETGSADAIWKTNFSFTLPAGTYTFSLNTFTMASYIKKTSDNSNLAVVNGTTLKTATFTITEQTEVYLGFYMYNLSFSNLATTYQLEKGSTATTYAPYVTAFGKNLCNPAEVTDIFLYNLADKAAYLSGNTSVVIPVEQNNSYTVSTTETQSRYRVAVCDSIPVQGGGDVTCYSGSNIDNTSNSVTINSGTHKYLIVNATDLSKIQIEKGSTATTYEPNMSGQLELCKIGTYQDYIYSVNGEWYLHKEVGKEDMSALSGLSVISTGNFIASGFASTYGSVIGEMRSNIFTYSDTGWEKVGKFGIAASGNMWAMTGDSTITTANISTWLSNKNAVVYYALATPTDTQITDAALIAQLEALNSATTYAGVTWFKTESEYLPADTWAYVQIQAGGGVVWDNYGATWEEGGGGMIVNVNVDSIENVYPVWTVNGPTDTPILTNLTTGTSITYNGNITSSQTLVVDMLNQTALLNGTSVIGKLSGDWIELAPGMNRMSYTATNEQTAPKSTLEWQEIVG